MTFDITNAPPLPSSPLSPLPTLTYLSLISLWKASESLTLSIRRTHSRPSRPCWRSVTLFTDHIPRQTRALTLQPPNTVQPSSNRFLLAFPVKRTLSPLIPNQVGHNADNAVSSSGAALLSRTSHKVWPSAPGLIQDQVGEDACLGASRRNKGKQSSFGANLDAFMGKQSILRNVQLPSLETPSF
jgi:hypothetical protein